MATYVKDFNGYIADVPRLWFKRCDGRVFYFDELTAATVTPSVETTPVNAGWSLFPVAYLPGASTFEMSITSGKFEADLFTMANAVDFETNAAYQEPVYEELVPDANNQVELQYKATAHSVSIRGMSEATTAATGKFTVDNSGDQTVITFYAGDVDSNGVKINYTHPITAQEANIDNRSAAMGEAVMKYPVYGSGDDCTDSSIIGYVYVRVYKCRVTAAPGFDASYKSAQTFQFTLSVMDAKRANDEVYSIAYVKTA